MLFVGVVPVEINEMAAVQQKHVVVRGSWMSQKRSELFEGLAQIVVFQQQASDKTRTRMADPDGDGRILLALQMLGELVDYGLQYRAQIPSMGESRPLEERLQMRHRSV